MDDQTNQTVVDGDVDVEGIISELASEFQEEGEGQVEQQEAAPETPEAPAPEPEVPPSIAEDPRVKGALEVLAEKEAAFRHERQAFESQRSEAEQLRARIAELEAAQSNFTRDPLGAIKALAGVNSAEEVAPLLQNAYYSLLGDSAPEEYRGKALRHQVMHEIEQLRREKEELKKQVEETFAVRERESRKMEHLRSLVEVARASESTPFVQKLASKNPEGIANLLFQAQQEQYQKDQTVLTPDEAAQVVNDALKAEWEQTYGLFGDLVNGTKTPAAPAQADPLTHKQVATKAPPPEEDVGSDEWLERQINETIREASSR